MVIGHTDSDSVQVVDNYKIRRNPNTGNIITTTEFKDYKIVFDKRMLGSDSYTYPYGM